MKTILVPTDFSECAEHALKHACILARKTKAKIILLHVIVSDRSEAPPLMMKLLRQTKKKMTTLLNSEICSKVEMSDFIEMGNVSEMVNASAREHKADIIVMGTHGAKGLNDIFIGSNAEHVVRDAEIPVLSIQDGKGKAQIKNIAFATDFSDETKYVFPFIKTFADIFGAKIQIVKIISDSFYKARMLAKKEAEDFLKENKFGSFPVTIMSGIRSKAEGISRFAEHNNADIIALGTHGRHGLAHFLKGSIAEDVVNYAFLPVLTVNFHKKLLKTEVEIPVQKKKVNHESEIMYQIPSI